MMTAPKPRDQMAEDDAGLVAAQRPRGGDEVLPAQTQHRSAHKPGKAHPAEDQQHKNDDRHT
jgi:hypothetical protein